MKLWSSFGLLIFLTLSCSSIGQVDPQSFLDRPFDFRSSLVEDSIVKDHYYSTKIDSFIGVNQGLYVIPDIVGTAFENYYVRVFSCLNSNRQVVLFYDQKDILRDSLMLSLDESFSLNATFHDGGIGVCVGEYISTNNYLKVKRVLLLNSSVKLNRSVDFRTLVSCTLPQSFLSEEDPNLSDSFTFGFDSYNILNIDLQDGEWDSDCENRSGYVRMAGDTMELELKVGEVGVWMILLEMRKDERKGTINLFFNRTAYVALPMGSEGKYFPPPSDDEVSKEMVVGTLKLIHSHGIELIWTGLYHSLSRKVLSQYPPTFPEALQGRISLRKCD
jgi:hypothetical protein